LKGYTALAGPPSFDTCSRDVYDTENAEDMLSSTFCWIIVTSMLRVLAKLHKLGICHGDFYAHNILVKPSSHDVKLSDFGAAFFYDRTNEGSYGHHVEHIELRSYTVLVHELYENYIVSPKNSDNDGDGGRGASDVAADTSEDDPTHSQWQLLMNECTKEGATFASLAEQFLGVAADK
jgi:serine/threonine protein kinase